MRYLFIGGVGDGRRIETGGSPDYNVMERAKLESFDYQKDGYNDASRYSRYRSVKFQAGGSVTLIYVDESIYRKAQSQDDLSELALHALIDGYRGSGEEVEEDEQRRRPTDRPFQMATGERPLTPAMRGKPPTSEDSQNGSDSGTTSPDYRDAMKRALMEAMSGPPKWKDPEGLTFMGNPVTMDEIMGLAMEPDCTCPVCTAKREGRAMGEAELKFLAGVMEQLESFYRQTIDAQVMQALARKERDMMKLRPYQKEMVEFISGDKWPEADYEIVEMRMMEMQRIPPPQSAAKKLSARIFDNSAPKRFKKGAKF